MQVKTCLQQNEELRNTLDRLRMEQASISGLHDKASQIFSDSNREDNTIESQYGADFFSLKVCEGNNSVISVFSFELLYLLFI